jgi:hypothetical protein
MAKGDCVRVRIAEEFFMAAGKLNSRIGTVRGRFILSGGRKSRSGSRSTIELILRHPMGMA